MKSLQEVEAEFVNQILVPEPRLPRQIFFCPVGLVGAGKTTVTKPIAEALGLVRVSSDELREILHSNGLGYDSVKQIGVRVITRFAREGYGIALDMDCGNPEVIDAVTSLAGELRAPIFWIRVTAPEEHIFEKFRRHPPSWLADNPETMVANYRAQKERRLGQKRPIDFSWEFDTSSPSLAEEIEGCVRMIKDKV